MGDEHWENSGYSVEAWQRLIYRALGIQDAVRDKPEAARYRVERRLEETVWGVTGMDTSPPVQRQAALDHVLSTLARELEKGQLDRRLTGRQTCEELVEMIAQDIDGQSAGSDPGRERHAVTARKEVLRVVLEPVCAWVADHPFGGADN